MEFYIYNKDDNKLKTAVNLATQFKIGEENYIVYYNTQVEKTSLDIYIGQISYGNNNLVISKISVEKQNEFLNIIKDILAGKNPETEKSDYANIIDTATIVLDSVQKIQIPTKSLDTLIKYHNPSVENEESNDIIQNENINNEEKNENNQLETAVENKEENNIIENKHPELIAENKEENITENRQSETSQNIIDTDLSGLDSLINQNDTNKKEKLEKKKAKSNKQINTPLLVMLILTIIVGIIYAIFNYLI